MNRNRALFLLFVILLCCCIPAAGEDGTAAFSNNWYEIFVRSFQDSNGDGIGDLPGVTERLDYLQEMGYNGIWLMPVMPSPSYHKYDVTDYLSIDPEYGSLADMKRLMTEAHARGIRVILDLPLNHSALTHPWFKAPARSAAAPNSTRADFPRRVIREFMLAILSDLVSRRIGVNRFSFCYNIILNRPFSTAAAEFLRRFFGGGPLRMAETSAITRYFRPSGLKKTIRKVY